MITTQRSRVMEGNVALMHKIALAKQKIEEMKEDVRALSALPCLMTC